MRYDQYTFKGGKHEFWLQSDKVDAMPFKYIADYR